jgi:hypothetical protein
MKSQKLSKLVNFHNINKYAFSCNLKKTPCTRSRELTTLFVLNKLFSLKELLEMSHLPEARHDQNAQLSDTPPEDALICRLTCGSESLFSILNKTKINLD